MGSLTGERPGQHPASMWSGERGAPGQEDQGHAPILKQRRPSLLPSIDPVFSVAKSRWRAAGAQKDTSKDFLQTHAALSSWDFVVAKGQRHLLVEGGTPGV